MSNQANPEDQTPPDDRLIKLETRSTYLEGAVEDLNAALLTQGKTLEAQTGEIRRLKAKLAYLEETLPSETPSPADERPPHY